MHEEIKLILQARETLCVLAAGARRYQDEEQEGRFVEAHGLLNDALLVETRLSIERDIAGEA
jgi:hypothetical protein